MIDLNHSSDYRPPSVVEAINEVCQPSFAPSFALDDIFAEPLGLPHFTGSGHDTVSLFRQDFVEDGADTDGVGTVCPERGTGAALVLPHANTESMNLHLAEIARCVALGAHAVVLPDQAGWHRAVETIWQFLRQNKLAIQVWDDYEAIAESCCEAWN